MSNTLFKNWEIVAEDLDLDIVESFVISLPGVDIRSSVLVRNFGHKNGMLSFMERESVRGFGDEIVELGYGFSVFSEPSHSAYDRDVFIEILND